MYFLQLEKPSVILQLQADWLLKHQQIANANTWKETKELMKESYQLLQGIQKQVSLWFFGESI